MGVAPRQAADAALQEASVKAGRREGKLPPTARERLCSEPKTPFRLRRKAARRCRRLSMRRDEPPQSRYGLAAVGRRLQARRALGRAEDGGADAPPSAR